MRIPGQCFQICHILYLLETQSFMNYLCRFSILLEFFMKYKRWKWEEWYIRYDSSGDCMVWIFFLHNVGKISFFFLPFLKNIHVEKNSLLKKKSRKSIFLARHYECEKLLLLFVFNLVGLQTISSSVFFFSWDKFLKPNRYE